MNWRDLWPRFSLKTVFIAIALLSACLAHFALRARDVHYLRTQIAVLGGTVTFAHEVDEYGNDLQAVHHPLPQFIRDLIGDDIGVSPFSIACGDEQVAGHDFDFLSKCHCAGEIRNISLNHTHVGDEAIDSLTSIPCLRSLELAYTSISNDGVRKMAHMKRLEFLDVTGTQIDDSTIEDFAKFASLKFLIIGNTGITSEGVTRLRELIPNCEIQTDYNFIFD